MILRLILSPRRPSARRSTRPRRYSNHLNSPVGISKQAFTPSDNSATTRYQAARDSNGVEGNYLVARESVSKLRGPMSHARSGGCGSPYKWIGDCIWTRSTWKYTYSPSLDEASNAQVIVRSPDQGTKRSEDKSPAKPCNWCWG
jgi:hypothetical protein